MLIAWSFCDFLANIEQTWLERRNRKLIMEVFTIHDKYCVIPAILNATLAPNKTATKLIMVYGGDFCACSTE